MHTNAPQPPNPFGPYGAPPPAPRKRKGPLFWLAVVGAPILGLTVMASCVASLASNAPPPSSGAPAVERSQADGPAETVADEPTEAAEPTPYTPVASDFKITVKVLSKQCFGSAGCSLTYRIKPAYSGPSLSEDTTYTVTYRVTGGESPQVNNFELTGDEASFPSEEFISTKSSSSTLKAKVTEVLSDGL
jgi:hypothetical protein